MEDPGGTLAARKREHVRVCLEEKVEHPVLRSGFSGVRLPYMSLPERDLGAVDLSVEVLGRRLSVPFVICGMTGGARLSATINRNLAAAAQEVGVALGLGSMRVALEGPEAAASFMVRSMCPDVPLFANLGAAQLNRGYGIAECRSLVEMIEADGLCLHVNALQEAAQTGGDTDWRGLVERIGEVAAGLEVPVVVKEVGFGVCGEVARGLERTPVWGIDVGGAGGTSWLEVEKRVWGREDMDAFDEMGVETVRSIREVRAACPAKFVIGSGGVRNGVEAVKALALGADLAGAAMPFLAPAVESAGAVVAELRRFEREMSLAAFLCGAGNYEQSRNLEIIKS